MVLRALSETKKIRSRSRNPTPTEKESEMNSRNGNTNIHPMIHRCTVHAQVISFPSFQIFLVSRSVAPPRLWAAASLGFKSVCVGRTLCLSTPPLFLLRHQCLFLLFFPALQLPLHKGVEEAGPRLVLTIVAQVRPDRLGEVEEHVPRVPWDAPNTWGVLR